MVDGNLVLRFAATFLLLFCCLASDNISSKEQTNIYNRILFVGNSFTYYNNNLHTHLGNLLRSNQQYYRGVTRLRSATLSGSKLIENWFTIKSLVRNANKKWDLVIMHGHSSSFMTAEKTEEYRKNVKKISKYLEGKNIKTGLLMTWAYKNKPEMLANLKSGYTRLAKETNSLLIPAGIAFAKVQKLHPNIELYSKDILNYIDGEPVYKKDIKHPSVAGTYLTACLVYSLITEQSAYQLPYHYTLDIKTAHILQNIAYEIIRSIY